MASVTLTKLEKSYGALRIVKGIDLEINDGEFVVFVGPSGCGKSTTLRMVAGLETITGGEVRIGDRVVNRLAPRERDIAMVFQDYALYPHKTVRENMGFSLKVRGIAAGEAAARVDDAANMLGISHLLDRRPGQLSGGQRQRVAMGRAIVRRPQVFLFDEPLSNLDAKLRGQVRTEIKKLHQALRTTIIYVTHDQVEAMTLADRIVILKGGEIEQVGTPDEVYNQPASVFVGGFVGSPAMNFAKAKVEGGNLVFSNGDSLPVSAIRSSGQAGAIDGRNVTVGIRPEHFSADASQVSLTCQVQVVEPLGSDTLVHFAIGGETLTARMPPETRIKAGETLKIGVDPAKIHLFDAETERAI
ncbi:ABC transporter ATP-binding protein [Agrobacterium rubi]|uniref:Sn-glycerol-3-phosphate ABC transporter ATP-binding protein UgpC n=1 Tax=Agrobacterium rubi TaxID=28099 RepID=A0AAE7R927_9HYPH|nr:sn-glycerol-3-phosphate ABC transporter ATP-binding protein UgpC [Agrobacterium rubi]NTE88028.1 sn-glycerol-3-phosphate ABC transporter ATP-binding protein UgpC [Agrobacterium rubi]NTF03795.1 sn-glycerol-3-phosphate ABC transporter ATP-binding protein UgpC [Agrobacterium rubi]NTF38122.1 sn-glycerol-3-phosphate ABC transporter ATP-binding protein UgpC [Agrobacterium rubi]OCJ43633.1 glycerol-3-phosphate ABC transporter ATP-binding protein [Agrobacterium rubi]QTG01967.1 sn-glycerol-3-phosphate